MWGILGACGAIAWTRRTVTRKYARAIQIFFAITLSARTTRGLFNLFPFCCELFRVCGSEGLRFAGEVGAGVVLR